MPPACGTAPISSTQAVRADARPRVRRRLVLALTTAAILSVVALAATPAGRAAGAPGWNIVPFSGADPSLDLVLMGTTCTSSWNCWAVGGQFSQLQNGQPSAAMEHWDGTSWTVEADVSPAGTQASLLWGVSCVDASDCWAVGGQAPTSSSQSNPESLAEHWDGSSWTVVPSPNPAGYLFSVSCTAPGSCFAAGAVNDPNSGTTNGFIDQWDGSAWTVDATPASGQTYDQFDSVTCVSSSDCWAVGMAGPNQIQNGFLPNIAPTLVGSAAWIVHWDGTAWTTVPTPAATAPDGQYLGAVTCTSATQCWAVGTTTDAIGDPSTSLVDVWDGSQWSTVPSADTATGADILDGVTCLSAANCWAVGADGVENAQNQLNNNNNNNQTNVNPDTLIEHWDGSSWSVATSPHVSAWGYLNGVACVRGDACFADGLSLTNGGNSAQFVPLMEQLALPAAGNQGLTVSASDGGVFTFGDAGFHGSLGGIHLNAPIVGMAATPDGGGYWLVARDGGVFAFGDAGFYGSLGGTHLNKPIVGMAATPDGKGYWLVAADGGVFSAGDAAFYGSLGGTPLNKPIVGMAATPDGKGYWLVASDGGVFTFGDSGFHGALGGTHLNAPVVGMAATPDGGGYWLVAADGGVFSGGNADYVGSVPGQGIRPNAPVTGMAVAPDGNGYWLVGSDGAVYSYGDASFLGSLAGRNLGGTPTGVAAD